MSGRTPDIERLFAYISDDGTGEGLIGAPIGPGGTWTPLIGADADRMLSYRSLARQVARESGNPVRLVRFDVRTEVEVFNR